MVPFCFFFNPQLYNANLSLPPINKSCKKSFQFICNLFFFASDSHYFCTCRLVLHRITYVQTKIWGNFLMHRWPSYCANKLLTDAERVQTKSLNFTNRRITHSLELLPPQIENLDTKQETHTLTCKYQINITQDAKVLSLISKPNCLLTLLQIHNFEYEPK